MTVPKAIENMPEETVKNEAQNCFVGALAHMVKACENMSADDWRDFFRHMEPSGELTRLTHDLWDLGETLRKQVFCPCPRCGRPGVTLGDPKTEDLENLAAHYATLAKKARAAQASA
jgi:hypothetical protein